MSFYSGSLYRDIVRHWKGYCFTYLLLLLSLCLVPEMLRMHEEFSDFLATETPKFVDQMPTVTISRGVASTDVQTPHFINYPDKAGTFAIIDTTGKFTSLDNTDAIMLLTGTKLFVRKDRSETRSFDLSPVDKLIVDRKLVYEWVRLVRDWSAVVLYPFVLLFSFLLQTIQVFMSAAIGSLFAKRFKIDLDYRALVRLAAVSFTPAIVLQAAHSLLNIDFPYSSFISFLIATGYLYYAVAMNSGEESEIGNRDAERG